MDRYLKSLCSGIRENMCEKCKMAYEETELIWVEVDGKMKLLCRNCKDLVL